MAQAWLVMSSYNSINGITATENELLETSAEERVGIDGVVVSDWTADAAWRAPRRRRIW